MTCGLGATADADTGAVDLPLFEHDLQADGLLEPTRLFAPTRAPRRAVMCFFQEVIDKFGDNQHATMTNVYRGRPMYETERHGERVAFFYPGLGAPAAVSSMEEAVAMGCRSFIAVGGAGSLVPELTLGHAVVVDRAIRDEGTSYHYMAPSRTVAPDPGATAALVAALRQRGVPFLLGGTWTTDAIFRETAQLARRRAAEGCLTVEMEAAAFFAVGRFRQVQVAQLLYAGDTLADDAWDGRDWVNARTVRELMFELALDAAASLTLDGDQTGG